MYIIQIITQVLQVFSQENTDTSECQDWLYDRYKEGKWDYYWLSDVFPKSSDIADDHVRSDSHADWPAYEEWINLPHKTVYSLYTEDSRTRGVSSCFSILEVWQSFYW